MRLSRKRRFVLWQKEKEKESVSDEVSSVGVPVDEELVMIVSDSVEVVKDGGSIIVMTDEEKLSSGNKQEVSGIGID